MKPEGKEVFDSSWRKRTEIEECSIRDVDDFIQLHYLGKRPAVVMLCLVMKIDSYPAGCCVFSAAPRETSKRYGGETWELARLFISEAVPQNGETYLIGRSIRHIKQHRRGVKCLVSYADPGADHEGKIYRASNWTYDGMTDDERKSPRVDYRCAETGRPFGRFSRIPEGARYETVQRISKHRFIFRL